MTARGVQHGFGQWLSGYEYFHTLFDPMKEFTDSGTRIVACSHRLHESCENPIFVDPALESMVDECKHSELISQELSISSSSLPTRGRLLYIKKISRNDPLEQGTSLIAVEHTDVTLVLSVIIISLLTIFSLTTLEVSSQMKMSCVSYVHAG